MKNNNYDSKNVFGIIAGDRRQIYLADLLKKDNQTVLINGFDNETLKNFNLDSASVAKVIKESNIIILPLPVSRDGIKLLFSEIEINDTFLKKLKNKKIFCGSKNLVKNKYWKNLNVIDYSENEDFKVLNASPTAEGAIKIALENSNSTLRNSKCLISGFGRIGKVLCKLLNSFGAKVYTTVHNKGDKAWINLLNYKEININEDENLNFDFIFNTVPELLFDEFIIKKIPKNCLIIDLASTEGVDFKCAKESQIIALHELGIPGRFFPKTAADIIKKIIYNYL